MKSTIYLEALAIAKEKILLHLKGKAAKIKYLYSKPENTEAEVKRINAEDEHIRAVLDFVDDAETTIAAVQEESQQLRLQIERIKNEKLILFKSAAFWKAESQKQIQQNLNLLEVMERFTRPPKEADAA